MGIYTRSLTALSIACVASVSVWFRSKERGRAKNESERPYKKWGENSEKKHPYRRMQFSTLLCKLMHIIMIALLSEINRRTGVPTKQNSVYAT